MSEEDVEAAWEEYQAEMVQIMAEKLALFQEESAKVANADLSTVRQRLGLS